MPGTNPRWPAFEAPPPPPPPPLTEHFIVDEWEQPARRGLPAAPYPPEWVEERLRPLAELLEVLRAELGGRPVRIISGFRSRSYNAAIGGAPLSQHVEGRACDIMVEGVSPAEVHDTALRLHREGRIRLGGLGEYPKFTHIDVRPGALARWSG